MFFNVLRKNSCKFEAKKQTFLLFSKWSIRGLRAIRKRRGIGPPVAAQLAQRIVWWPSGQSQNRPWKL